MCLYEAVLHGTEDSSFVFCNGFLPVTRVRPVTARIHTVQISDYHLTRKLMAGLTRFIPKNIY
jgi:hypothetical protein